MARLFSEYPAPLTTADVLRQMYLFDLALSCLADMPTGQALSLRIRTLRGAGRDDEALRLLGDLDASQDDDVELRANRIAVLDRLHRYGDLSALLAQDHHAKLLGSDDHWVYRIRLAEARALASQGQVVEALAGFEEIARTANRATVHGWRLNALLRLGRRRDARTLADQLVTADGEHGVRHWITAGRVLSRLGDSDLAVATLLRATREAPCDPHAWRWLAATLRTVGDFTEAKRILDEAANVSVPVPAPALVSGADHGVPTAVSLARHPLLLVELALLHLARFDGANPEELDAARESAEGALTSSPDCAEAHWIKARVLRAAGGPEALAGLRRMARERVRDRASVSVELGHAYADVLRWPEALTEYDGVLRDNPRNREALLGRLTVLASRTAPTALDSRLAGAVDAVCRELHEDVVILSIAGERLAQRGHYALAGRLFDTVLRGPANPEHDLTYAGAIRAWAWARDFAAAEAVYERALDADDPSPPLVVGIARGMLLGDQGRFDEANRQFTTLYEHVRAKPPAERSRDDVAAVAIWVSTSYRWLAEYDLAAQVTAEALAPEPGQRELFTRSADLHDELGWTNFERQDWPAAEASFRQALAIDPRHAGALRGLLQVHRATGATDAAREVARRAQILHPTDPSIHCELAWLHGEAGQFRVAQRFLDGALARDVANAAALEWKIVYLIREGRLPDAEEMARTARGLRPESPGILEVACAVHLRRGAGALAVRSATTAYEARPTDPRFVTVAAAVCEQAGRPSDTSGGWRLWASRLAQVRGSLDAVRVEASLLRRHGQLAEARRLVEDALPDRWPGRRGELAEIRLSEGDVDGALTALYDLHAQLPWSASIAKRIATLLANSDRLTEALDFTGALLTRGGEPVELLVLHGELLLRANRFEEALEIAERAGRHPTRHVVEAQVLAIEALGAAGRLDEATTQARALRQARPGSRRVRLMLARCLEESRRGREAADLLNHAELALPHHPPAIIMTSWISRGINDYHRAEYVVRHALKHLPDESALAAELGWIQLGRANFAAARETFGQLTERPLPHEQALGHTGLGWCHLGGAPPDARAALNEFTKAIALDPQLPQARLGASEAEQVLARHEKADGVRRTHLDRSLVHARRLLDLERTSVSHSAVGRAAYELHDIVSAQEHLAMSVTLSPYRGDRVGLGLLLLRQGHLDQALDVLLAGMAHSPDDPDLLAAIGAVHLDRDLRTGEVGQDTHLAVRYLRDACLREPRHLFARHNLATALVRLGEPAAAEQILESALRDLHRAQRTTGVDVDDIPVVQLRLAEILRQRRGVATYPLSRARAAWFLASFRRNARGSLLALAGEANTLPLTRANEPHPNRLQTAAGYLVAALALAGLSALWTVWLSGLGTEPQPVSAWLIVTMTCALLGATFAGLSLPTIQKLRLGAVEINSFVELSRIVSKDLDLPEPAFRQGSYGFLDALRAQWTTPWSAETRLPRLGPAVSPLINSYRD